MPTKEKQELFPIDCSKCGCQGMEVTYFSDHTDSYTLQCLKCGNTIHLHYTAYDSIMEGYEDYKTYNNKACETVRRIHKYVIHCDNSKKFKEWIRKECKHIQTLELNYETAEYYENNGKYYIIGLNAGELRPKD